MSRENGLSMLDSGQVIQEVHNESEKALDVISANNLVPKRFGKVELTYITSGNGIGEVGSATYFSEGAYQSQTMAIHGDDLGTAHKTTVNFFNRTPENLSNTYFTIYEAAGPVTVWFSTDGTGVAPSVSNRTIRIDISSGDTEKQLAQKLNLVINTDINFFSVIQDVMVMIVNYYVGKRQDSKDTNTGLVLKNIQGSESNRLDGKFFYLNSALNTNQYYVWFNVDSISTDPAVPGKTAIEVPISHGASVESVIAALNTALAATGKFILSSDGYKFTITNNRIGATNIIVDVNCNFVFISLDKLGSNRAVIAELIMTYDSNNDLVSVERL